jgi:hypothetical protein
MINPSEELEHSFRHFYITEGYNYSQFRAFVSHTKYPFIQAKCKGGFRRFELPIELVGSEISRIRYEWIEWLKNHSQAFENAKICEYAGNIAEKAAADTLTAILAKGGSVEVIVKSKME